MYTERLARQIVELLSDDKDSIDPNSVSAVKNLLDLEKVAFRADALNDMMNSHNHVMLDLKKRAAGALYDGEASVPMTKGEFIIACLDQKVSCTMTPKGALFCFMGVPISKKALNG